MPFELGVDMACQRYKLGHWQDKKCLVLGAEDFAYQAALSDLAGSDIRSHGGKAARMTSVIRNWLNVEAGLTAVGPAAIWSRFNDFMADNFDALTIRGFSRADIKNIDISELVVEMRAWILANP
jgi:hypothetical protein